MHLHSPQHLGDILERLVVKKHLPGSVFWALARSWADLGPFSACCRVVWGRGMMTWVPTSDKLGLCPVQLQAGVFPPNTPRLAVSRGRLSAWVHLFHHLL